jgi:hypothetical protein
MMKCSYSHTAPNYLPTKSWNYALLFSTYKTYWIERSQLGLGKKDLEADAAIWSDDIDLVNALRSHCRISEVTMVNNAFGCYYRLGVLIFICILQFSMDILYSGDMCNVM